MNQENRNISFDILRITAAIFVLIVHMEAWNGYPKNVGNGYFGVWLFFILSGYLIFESLDKYEQLNWDSTMDYYKKRIIRIIPLYYSILIIIWIYDLIKAVILERIPLLSAIAGDGVCGIKYLRYFIFGQTLIPSNNFRLWNNRYILWTMSAFALFYVIAPIIKIISNSFIKSLVILLFFYWVSILVPDILRKTFLPKFGEAFEPFPEEFAFCVMYLFWIGVCAFYAIKENKTFMYALLLIIVYSTCLFQKNKYAVIFALFILLAASTDIKIKNNRIRYVITLMSKCSFPLYLTHAIWFDFVTRLRGHIEMDTISRLIVYIGGALVVAFVTYRLITPLENKLRSIL